MYVPPPFAQTDPAEIATFMRKHSFATVVTHDGHVPFASQVPVLHYREPGPHGRIIAHIARANPQWRHFDNGQEVLVMFHGPHAYISPAWYQTQPAVPTWNYAAVHAYGRPRIITNHSVLVSMLEELVETYERDRENRWPGVLPEEYRDKMIGGIVGFEIEITRIEAKYKLGQNRSAADIQSVVSALGASSDETGRELAAMMARQQEKGPFT